MLIGSEAQEVSPFEPRRKAYHSALFTSIHVM